MASSKPDQKKIGSSIKKKRLPLDVVEHILDDQKDSHPPDRNQWQGFCGIGQTWIKTVF